MIKVENFALFKKCPFINMHFYFQNLQQGPNPLERMSTMGTPMDASSGSSRGSSPESNPRRPQNSYARGISGMTQAQLLQQNRMNNNNLPPQVIPRVAPPPIPLRSPTTEVTTDSMRTRPHGIK